MANAPGRGPGRGHGGPRGGGRPKNSKQMILRLLAYIEQDKYKMILAYICVFANTLATLAGSYMLRPLINTYIVPSDGSRGSISGLAGGLAVLGCIYMVGVVANYLQARIMLTIAQGALLKIRTELFEKMQELPVKFYDTNANGDLMSRFTNDVDTIGNMLSNTLVQLFSGILSIIGTFALMLYTNVYLTIVTVVMLPVIMKAGGFVASRSRRRVERNDGAVLVENGDAVRAVAEELLVTGQVVEAVQGLRGLVSQVLDGARVADGDGGGVGQRPGEVDVLAIERPLLGAQQERAEGLALERERDGGNRQDARVRDRVLDLAKERMRADIVDHERLAGAGRFLNLGIAIELDAQVDDFRVVAGGHHAPMPMDVVEEDERAAGHCHVRGQSARDLAKEGRHVESGGVAGGQIEQGRELFTAASLLEMDNAIGEQRLDPQREFASLCPSKDKGAHAGAQGAPGLLKGVDNGERRDLSPINRVSDR